MLISTMYIHTIVNGHHKYNACALHTTFNSIIDYQCSSVLKRDILELELIKLSN